MARGLGSGLIGVNWILQSNREFSRAGAWALALLPNMFPIAALFAHLHFLRRADELIRRIQLEGLAIGFVAAVVFMIGWVAGHMIAAWCYQ